MSSTKICFVFVNVLALCVTPLVEASRVELFPHQTAATQQGGAVLFYVAYQGHLSDISVDPIIFNHVLVNQGSAYSNATGVFTAPIDGIYQFVFAAQICRGDHNNVWYFVVNREPRMMCHAQVVGTDTTLNTCYTMMKLKKGDRVWVRQKEGSCAWASTTSNTITFSGVLLASDGVSMLGKMYSASSCPLPSLGHYTLSSSAGRSAALPSVAITLLLCSLLWD